MFRPYEYIDEESAAQFSGPDGSSMTLTADEVVSLPENKYSDNAKEKILRDLGLVKIRQPEGLVERGVAMAKRATGAAAEGLLQEGKDFGRFAPIEAAQEAVASGVSAIFQPRTYSALREYERRTGRTLPNPNTPQFNIPQGVTSLAETPTGGPITDIAAGGLGYAAPYVATALLPGGAVVKSVEALPKGIRLAQAGKKGFGALRTAVKAERAARTARIAAEAVPGIAPKIMPLARSVAELGATGAVAEALSGRPEHAPVAGAQFAALGGITHTVGKVFEGFYKAGGESVLAQRAAETKAAEALRKFGEPVAVKIPIAPVADRIKYTVGALGTSRPVRAGIAGVVFGGIPVVTHPDWTWEDVAGNVISMSIFDFLAGGGARRPPLRAKLPSEFEDAISQLDARKKDTITNFYNGLVLIAAQKEAGRAGFEQAVGAGRVKFVKGEQTPEERGLLDAARARQDALREVSQLTNDEKAVLAQAAMAGERITPTGDPAKDKIAQDALVRNRLRVERIYRAGKISDDAIVDAMQKSAAKQAKAEAKAAKSAKTQTAVEQTIEQLEASGNTKAAGTVRKASEKTKEGTRAASPEGLKNASDAATAILAKDEQASAAVADQIKKNLGLGSELMEFRPFVESLGYDWEGIVADKNLRKSLIARHEAYKRGDEPPPPDDDGGGGGAPASIGPIPPVTPQPASAGGQKVNLTADWQEVPQDSLLQPGAEIRMDQASGKTFARMPQPTPPAVSNLPEGATYLGRVEGTDREIHQFQDTQTSTGFNVEGTPTKDKIASAQAAARARFPQMPQTGAAKEPWEMTRAEFDSALAQVTHKKLKPWIVFDKKTKTNSLLPNAPRDVVEAWNINNAGRDHDAIVERAIRQGKPVPPEVLAEYGLIPPEAAASEQPRVPVVPQQPTVEVAPREFGPPVNEGPVERGTASVSSKQLELRTPEEIMNGRKFEFGTSPKTEPNGRYVDLRKDVKPDDYVIAVVNRNGKYGYVTGRVMKVYKGSIALQQIGKNGFEKSTEKISVLSEEGQQLARDLEVYYRAVKEAIHRGDPVSSEAVDKFKITIPSNYDYVKVGDRYVEKLSGGIGSPPVGQRGGETPQGPETGAKPIRGRQGFTSEDADAIKTFGEGVRDEIAAKLGVPIDQVPLEALKGTEGFDQPRQITTSSGTFALDNAEGVARVYSAATGKRLFPQIKGYGTERGPQRESGIGGGSKIFYSDVDMAIHAYGSRQKAIDSLTRQIETLKAQDAEGNADRIRAAQGTLEAIEQTTAKEAAKIAKIKFRLIGKLPATHISEETGKGVLNRLYRRILGGPEKGFRFVSNAAGIPASALRSITNDTARIRGQIAGVYSNGTVYLNLAAHQSPAELTRTVMHELAHVAESLAGPEIRDMRATAILQRAGAAHEIARKYGLDLTKATDKDIAGGEIIADMLMNGERNGIVDRAVSVVRNLLRRLGVIKAYNDIDLRAYTERLFRGLLRGRIGYRVPAFDTTDSLSKQQLAEVDHASAWFRSNPIDAIKDPIIKVLRAKGIKATGWARALVEPQETLQIGPEGAKLAQLLAEHVWTPSGVIAGSPLKVLEDSWRTLSLSDKHWIGKNWAEFWKRYDYKVPFDKNPRIEAFARAASQTMHMLAQRAIADNVEIFDPDAPGGHRLFKEIIEQVIGKRYHPQQLSTGARRAIENKDTTDPRYIYLVEEKGLNPDELAPKMNGASNVHYSARKEAWEHVRSLELEPMIQRNGKSYAILETDPFTVFFDRIHNMGRRLAMIEAFGQRALPDDLAQQRGGVKNPAIAEYLGLDPIEAAKLGPDKLSEMIFEKLEKAGEHDAALTWSSVWANFNGINLDKLGKLVPYLEDLETIARTGQLSGSTVSNIFGLIAIAPRLGIRNTARALYQRLEAEIAWRMGYESKNLAELKASQNLLGWSYSIVPFLSQSADLTGHLKRWSNLALTAVGFPGINRIINQVTALAAKNALDEAVLLLRNPKDSFLRRRWGKDPAGVRRILKTNFNFSDGQINEMVEKGIQESHFAQASQHAASKINVFRESPLQRPLWMNDGLARRFGAYLSYVRQQGKMFRDAFFEAKVHNNYRPLSTMILGYAVGGAAMTAFRNYIYRRESEDKDFAANVFNSLNAMGTFGLLGTVEQDIVWNYRLGKTSLLNVPMWDWWWSLGVGAAKDMGTLYQEGKIGDAEWKALARNIPVVRFVDAHIQGPYYQSYNRKLKSSRTTGQSAYTFSY